MKYLVLLTCLLAASLLAQDAPRYPDPYDGHAQPAACNNSYRNTHPCTCNRGNGAKCDGTEKYSPDNQCQTRCRPKACGCLAGCS